MALTRATPRIMRLQRILDVSGVQGNGLTVRLSAMVNKPLIGAKGLTKQQNSEPSLLGRLYFLATILSYEECFVLS
jgi:hypothetical protein